MPENKADAQVDDIVANMQKVKAASTSGRSHASLLAEETPTPPLAETPPEIPEGVTVTIPASDMLIRMRPAEDATPPAPIGMSERGWSPEVTARDPRLIAAELETMLAEAGGPATDEEVASVTAASGSDLEVRLNNLRVDAVTRINNRLAQGIGRVTEGGAEARVALTEAVTQAKARVEQFRTENPPKETPKATPTPAPTSTASTPPAPPSRTRTHE
jgi:hypothetical protein